jgi:hypothetical protein
MSPAKNPIAEKVSHFASGIPAILTVTAVLALSGCANFSKVISENADGSYHVSATTVSYTMSMDDLTAATRQKASAWCADQGKDMQLRQQVRGWKPAQVDLDFRCLARVSDIAAPIPETTKTTDAPK